jgi:hypothetical protein
MNKYATLNPEEVILKRERRKRENNGEDELNRYIVHMYGNVTMKHPLQLL